MNLTNNDLFKLCLTDTLVNTWNSLPSNVVSAKTPICFKSRLDTRLTRILFMISVQKFTEAKVKWQSITIS